MVGIYRRPDATNVTVLTNILRVRSGVLYLLLYPAAVPCGYQAFGDGTPRG